MQHFISWSVDAADELAQIVKYIREHSSKKTASDVYNRIKVKVDSTMSVPESGRIVPELSTIGINDIHEFIENPWRIFYKVVGQEIRIISIIDGRRNLEEILYKKIMDGKLR